MDVVKDGDKVQLICEIKLEDGTLCYKNEKEDPLELVVGKGSFFPVVEKELRNMKVGETKTLKLQPNEAFGHHQEQLVVDVPNNCINMDKPPAIGDKIKYNTPDGKKVVGTVLGINDNSLKVDFNHPLAGKKIVFTVT
ncbi:MAG: FKBP-type peptidyl-prolyl cis-trans isomerase, partial [Candidatus Thermoplasmatota archaeon]|nr:FKBP-type peptidyl-prolyl cis-trans isomerase [Candidatus Thermoplasmatota archaeon]